MLIRQSMIYVAAKVLPGFLGMATTSILTHILTPRQYGLYGLSLVVVAFGVHVAFDWLPQCLTRFYEARRRDPKVISTVMHIFAVNVLLSAVALVLIWQVGLLPGPEGANYAMGVVMMWTTAWFELVACIEIVNLCPMAYFNMNLGRATCVLGAAVAIAWLTHDPLWTGAGTALGIFLGSLFRRTKTPSLGPKGHDGHLAREMVAFGLPLAVAMLMASMTYTGTRVMVEWFGSPEALGYYTAAFVLIQNMLVVVSSGIGAASYPLAVRAFESGDRAGAKRQLLENATLLLAVMAPLSLGAALTAHGIATTLVGPQYAEEVATLTPWMAAAAFFMSIRGCYLDQSFQLGHRPFLLVRILCVAAIISLALAYWLLPRLGPEGAAIAVTVALGLACIHSRLEGRGVFQVPLPIVAGAKIMLACGAMTVGVLSMRGDTTLHFTLQVIVGGIAYTASMVALNMLGLRDRLFEQISLRLPQRDYPRR